MLSQHHVLIYLGVILYFKLQNNVIVSIWSMAQDEDPRWLKSCLVAGERGSGRSPVTRQLRRPSQSLLGFKGSQLCTWQAPNLGADQPVKISQMVAHLLDEFHLLLQAVALQEVTEMKSVRAESRECRSKRAWFRFFSRAMASRLSPNSSWGSSACPESGHSHCASFASSADTQCPCTSPGSSHRSSPCSLWPCGHLLNRKPREWQTLEGCRCRVTMKLMAVSTLVE